jgi:multidrug resistance efflux pump
VSVATRDVATPEVPPEVTPEAPKPAAPPPQPQLELPPTAPAKRSRRVPIRAILLPIVLIALVVAAWFGYNTYRDGQTFVSTDNAQLTGQLVQVGSMNPGRVEAVLPSIGSTVHKGDVVARVALPSQVGTTQAGQPRMDFLGPNDTQVEVRSPLDGVVVTNPAAVGATVAAGQPIVTIVDPNQLWVNANVEETSVGRVRVGQPVTVHVDALGTDVPGKVDAITPATAGMTSILPPSNAQGNYTKVTQLVPVRVAVNLGNHPLLLGANVEVKIRTAE